MHHKLKIFCVTNKALPSLENSPLYLAGVGKQTFNKNYLSCSTKKNIFHKEKYYSELTFHYWYWKNLLQNEDAQWVGFCQKRRFWIKKNLYKETIDSKNLSRSLLFEPESDWKNFDSVLCTPIDISGAKKIKLIKRGWKNILKNPSLLFGKQETLKIHFDLHHGYGNLDKAINLLKDKDKENFNTYVSAKSIYNPHIMFICRPELLDKWFSNLFEWLENCESIFGFSDLKGYDTTRLYAFLAERYLSYWFKKYTKYTEHPWTFIDH